MKKLIYISCLLILAGINIQAQGVFNNNKGNRMDSLSLKRTNFSLQTGTSFSTGAFQGSTFYVAPSMVYNVSSKFRVKTTVYFINSNITASDNTYLNLGDNQPRLFDRKTNETVVFASGDYQLNSKLLITGSFVKNFNNTPGANSSMNAYSNSFQMMSLGMEYKITPNVSFGADFKFIQSNNPYLHYMHNSFGYGNGYNMLGMPYSNF